MENRNLEPQLRIWRRSETQTSRHFPDRFTGIVVQIFTDAIHRVIRGSDFEAVGWVSKDLHFLFLEKNIDTKEFESIFTFKGGLYENFRKFQKK